MHNHETAGHFGEEATYGRIKDRFYWKNMKSDIKIMLRHAMFAKEEVILKYLDH